MKCCKSKVSKKQGNLNTSDKQKVEMHISFLDPDTQLQVLTGYLSALNKKIKHVERNGLCIFSSVREVLAEKNIDRTIDDLKETLRQEIYSKSSDYDSFSSATIDVRNELEKFLEDPEKEYASPSVDLVLPALLTALKIRGTVYKINEAGHVSTLDIGPEVGFEITGCCFAQTTIRHVDPVLNTNIYVIVKEEPEHSWPEEQKPHVCRRCHRSFDGRLRLARHACANIIPVSSNTSPIILISSDEDGEDCDNDISSDGGSSPERVMGSDLDDDDNDDDDDDQYSSDTSEMTNDESTYGTSGIRIYGPQVWRKVTLVETKVVPHDINGKCAYKIKAPTRTELLERCSDGRPWAKDSPTTWKTHDNVRYKNCRGSLRCPRLDCEYRREYGKENRLKYGKNKACICGATGERVPCRARKYTAYVSKLEADVYHVGEHTCEARLRSESATDFVRTALLVDPRVTPSTIQNNAILSAIRSRSDWDEVNRIVGAVGSKKKISNEKIKQRKQMDPAGNIFESIKDLKKYLDVMDPFLVYRIDENRQIVFKTSKTQMEIAMKVDCTSTSSFLSSEYCCFDGKVNRTKGFTTLTASTYHPFLQEQVPLAIMDCISEDGDNVGVFWRLFNDAFKEVNSSAEKFNPCGWVTDMAASNFNGLAMLYGEDVIYKVKGCEFHYKRSVSERARKLKDDGEQFEALATKMLTASTKEAYSAAYKGMLSFVAEVGREELMPWLDWWHARRENMFRAFTGQNKPFSNQAEVVHASWVNRGETGMTLRETAEFDATDALKLGGRIDRFEKTKEVTGRGPNIGQKRKRINEREIQAAHQSGSDFVNFGITIDSETNNDPSLVLVDDGCQPRKRTRNSNKDLFKPRLAAATKGEMKIRDIKNHSSLKKVFKVANSARGILNFEVVITNTPSCTCVDYQKYKAKVLCKHIIYVVIVVLEGADLMDMLKNRYFGDDDVKTLIAKQIPTKYIQKKEKKTRQQFASTLTASANYDDEQTLLLHKKGSRPAKCTACRTQILPGTNCFALEGALHVPFNTDKACPRKFYVCAKVTCILAPPPPWTNIRMPTMFRASEDVPNEDSDRVKEECNLCLV